MRNRENDNFLEFHASVVPLLKLRTHEAFDIFQFDGFHGYFRIQPPEVADNAEETYAMCGEAGDAVEQPACSSALQVLQLLNRFGYVI